MNVFPYQPSPSEVALAQAWIASSGYGSALTPWLLNTDDMTFNVPTTSGGGMVKFKFGEGVFASAPSPQGSVNQGAGPAPATTAAAVSGGLSLPLLLGIGAAVWYFLLRKKR